MTKDVVVYTDGAARGNPGPSASGFLVVSGGKIIASDSQYLGIKTNNHAEYTAIMLGLEWCASNMEDAKTASIKVRSDSELVIRQLAGKYKVKAIGLKGLNVKVHSLALKFGSVGFENRPREDVMISKVDAELNRLLDTIKKDKA